MERFKAVCKSIFNFSKFVVFACLTLIVVVWVLNMCIGGLEEIESILVLLLVLFTTILVATSFVFLVNV